MLLIVFLFFSIGISAQAKVDTVRCGSVVGYGKIVNGKKEGLWKYKDTTYYTPSFTGTYLNNKKTGKWEIYPLPYTPRYDIINYEKDIPEGSVKMYYDNKLWATGSYIHGLKNGEWIYYKSSDQKIQGIEYYKNGVPYGIWKYYSSEHSCWSGPMNELGKNGYWISTDTIYTENPDGAIIKILTDSFYYLNDKEEGFWNNEYGKGNFSSGKKEGRWIEPTNLFYSRHTEYKNGIKEGYDSIFYENIIDYTCYYSNGVVNGTESFFSNGKLIAQGKSIPNPCYHSPKSNNQRIFVPIHMQIELIENGIADHNLYTLSDYGNYSPAIRDSLLRLLKHTSYIPVTVPTPTPFSAYPSVRTGLWTYYWENGNKKEEGVHLPIVKDSMVWDSTNQTEDPNNPGTYIMAPLKTEVLTFYKTGWWKYYNEQGVMIHEERFDGNGELVEIKSPGKK
ncbi:MAG: hypothetical protein M3R17_12280 [Bacteroidota bacterium]|nr:hypothetical protein [Bacteroidota bacterium]